MKPVSSFLRLLQGASAALVLVACTTPGTVAPGSPDEVKASSADSPSHAAPPDFELDTLTGDSLRLSEAARGRVVLLDFWATFCQPCLAAMPRLQSLHEKYRDRGLVILGISIDGPDSVAQVRSEVQKLGITFPILLDQETEVVALYNPQSSAPFSVLIGRDGRIIDEKEGYSTSDADALERDIVAALERR